MATITMALLVDEATLAADATFKGRVQQGVVTTAIAIYNESQNTPGHGNRALFAKQALSNPANATTFMIFGVVTDTTVGTQASSPPVQGNVTDAAILNALSSQWNSYAGA